LNTFTHDEHSNSIILVTCTAERPQA